MKRFSISKKVWLTAAAVALTAGISLPGAMAYFTTYASASGGASLSLSNTVTIPEEQVRRGAGAGAYDGD